MIVYDQSDQLEAQLLIFQAIGFFWITAPPRAAPDPAPHPSEMYTIVRSGAGIGLPKVPPVGANICAVDGVAQIAQANH